MGSGTRGLVCVPLRGRGRVCLHEGADMEGFARFSFRLRDALLLMDVWLFLGVASRTLVLH